MRRRAGGGADPAQPTFTWREIFNNFECIEVDLHQIFGIDIADPELMEARPYHWLRRRIIRLISLDSLLANVLRGDST